MKIRQGFVSNSSSSSFLVIGGKHIFDKGNPKLRLTKQQIRKLKKLGFSRTAASDISHVSFAEAYEDDVAVIQKRLIERERLKDPMHKDTLNFKLVVIVNQDDILEPLIKAKIPFHASIHYDHKRVAYHPETDRLFIGENLGNQMTMFPDGKIDEAMLRREMREERPFRIISGKDYLCGKKFI